MKKISYILSFVALTGALASCSHDYQPMGGVISSEQRDKLLSDDEANYAALNDGMYTLLSSGSSTNFGWDAIFIMDDSRTADFVTIKPNAAYSYFGPCAQYQDNTASSGFTSSRWTRPYNLIYSANQLLKTLKVTDPDDTNDLFNYYKAQAMGLRAFAYNFLIQTFQFTYLADPDALGVPILTEDNMDSAAIYGAPRSSVREVYDQIFSDLDKSIALMTNNPKASRDDKRFLDINVLYGLYARAALLTGDYENAAKYAQLVIDSGNFTPLSSEACQKPGFSDISASNWIWGIYYDTTTVVSLYNFPSMVSSWASGYAQSGQWILINPSLYDAIFPDDPRKLWWISPEGVSAADYYTGTTNDMGLSPTEYLEYYHVPTYANVKFAPYNNVLGQSTNAADSPLMRIEEMYYILAEAQAKGGNLSQGIQTLNNFVTNYRWTGDSSYNFSASSLDEFIDEIWFQRRVEFWGEGIGYFDLLRLQKTMDRKERNSIWTESDDEYGLNNCAYRIPAGEKILILQIPVSEIDNNPARIQQNPTGEPTNKYL